MAKNLDELFSMKMTENGDVSFNKVSTDNQLLNILFLTEYYQKHLDEVKIGNTDKDKLFAMFVRDPRFGLGRRDLGRELLKQTNASIEDTIKSGRFDDIFTVYGLSKEVLDFAYNEILKGNELVKKWMPRYSSKNLMLARAIAKAWGMNKQQYGHFIKCNTTEQNLSRKTTDNIIFEQVPSLAILKYYNRFKNGEDTIERFASYINEVNNGTKKLNVSTSTVYDIYKNRGVIDADLFFDKIEKIAINCIPVVDTSGSMCDSNDSYGKAMAIGHYLSKCSTYAPNKVVSFSSQPQLITLGESNDNSRGLFWSQYMFKIDSNSQYSKEIASMHTGDCSNTDFGAVMELFKSLDNTPEYLVVLSDMEFDQGSNQSKEELKKLWEEKGYNTKIVWWNLNSRNITCPEMDSDGNIFLSGYNPMLLKFIEVSFDGSKFLNKLLEEYKKNIDK